MNAETGHRGVTAVVSIEPWPDDPRYVHVVLNVDPLPGGLGSPVYSVLVKAPEAIGWAPTEDEYLAARAANVRKEES